MARSSSNRRGTSKRKRDVFSALKSNDIRVGFEDGLLSKPWPKDFDKIAEVSQLRYELGRRVGAVYASYVKVCESNRYKSSSWFRQNLMICGEIQRPVLYERRTVLHEFEELCAIESRI